MKVGRLALWPTSPSPPLPRLGHDVPVVSTRGQCGPNMAASWWDNDWCPSTPWSASASFHSSVSTFFWLCSNKIPSNYISNVCFSLFQLRLARYAVPLVMISCLYFKVNHYLFIYIFGGAFYVLHIELCHCRIEPVCPNVHWWKGSKWASKPEYGCGNQIRETRKISWNLSLSHFGTYVQCDCVSQ